jgi:hypothetical protein
MNEMNRFFPPARYPTIHICRSIEDVLELNESSMNHFDDKNIIICVDSSIPQSCFNNNGSNDCILKLGNNIFEL